MVVLPLASSPVSLILLLAATALPATAQAASGPVQITHGGTYSGRWTSNDPKTPAVSIRTDEPVVLRNSTVSGRGNLIVVNGVKTGASVDIENVTGAALDPGVAGTPRGAFVLAAGVHALTVQHCTITGTAFGVAVAGSHPATLRIVNNRAADLEDRASDGQGGLLAKRPTLGHFVILNHVIAAQGAEIAWNQSVQTLGATSTEDVINIYESAGAPGHPIHVHDNYLEGASTAVPGKSYTGTALIADGSAAPDAVPTAWVLFENNIVVATAGTGIGIAFGHDITARNNRVVSCGVDASGRTYAWGASAAIIWNIYKSPQFYNNTITGTTGGMVAPGPNHQFKAANTWIGPGTDTTTSTVHDNSFTDPCLVNGQPNLHAEADERARWQARLAAAHQTVGAR